MRFIKVENLKYLLEVNFYASVILLLAGSFLSVSDNHSLLEFKEDLYGALNNNLRMIMVYLGMTELVILIYCFIKKNFRSMILVGFFLILMVGSTEFYGEINTIEIDSNFPIFFFYTGISHVLFGVIEDIVKNSPLKNTQQLKK
ncbi:MAG: hypothetical protein WCG16_08880 [Methylococcales bacterium]